MKYMVYVDAYNDGGRVCCVGVWEDLKEAVRIFYKECKEANSLDFATETYPLCLYAIDEDMNPGLGDVLCNDMAHEIGQEDSEYAPRVFKHMDKYGLLNPLAWYDYYKDTDEIAGIKLMEVNNYDT